MAVDDIEVCVADHGEHEILETGNELLEQREILVVFEKLHLSQANPEQRLGLEAENLKLLYKSCRFTKQGNEIFDSTHQPLEMHFLLDLVGEIKLLLTARSRFLWIKLDKNWL